jgi:hypothetical protein
MDAKRGVALLPIISELGTNALVLDGDILLSLSKYKYAILAYEAGNVSHRYRTGVDFYALERRLCDICTKNEDFERSLKYHHRILTKSTEDGNLNMYVYIVQQMAKLHVLQGNFRKSEDVLRGRLVSSSSSFTHLTTIISCLQPHFGSCVHSLKRQRVMVEVQVNPIPHYHQVPSEVYLPRNSERMFLLSLRLL